MKFRLVVVSALFAIGAFLQIAIAGDRGLPSGKITFVKDGNIWIMDFYGKNQKQITDSGKDSFPSISKNIRWVVFASNRDNNSEIYKVDIDGKNQVRLTENNAHDSNPIWLPNSKNIAFLSTRDGNSEIYVMDADGKEQIRLTDDRTYKSSLAWSPDGKKIAFISYRNNEYGIYVIDADGKNEIKLLSDNLFKDSLTWSPDGKKLTFNSRSGMQSSSLYLLDSNGGNLKKLIDDVKGIPIWSSDGRRLALETVKDNRRKIITLDTNSKNEKELADLGPAPVQRGMMQIERRVEIIPLPR